MFKIVTKSQTLECPSEQSLILLAATIAQDNRAHNKICDKASAIEYLKSIGIAVCPTDRYKGHDRLIQFIQQNKLFEQGDIFNRATFEQALRSRGLLQQFNEIYYTDTNSTGFWSMFDFTDRFKRFTDRLCKIGYCVKIKPGTFVKN